MRQTMKTEITINGITYNVGDVLECRQYKSLCKILAVGDNTFFVKTGDNFEIEAIAFFNDLENWKIKKPKKKVVIERWINCYSDGSTSTWVCKEDADSYNMHSKPARISCEHFRREYEIDE